MRHQWWVQLHPKCKTLGAKGDPADGRICYIRADEWKSIKVEALPLLAAVNTSKRDILVRCRISLECALLVTHTAVPVLIAARFHPSSRHDNAFIASHFLIFECAHGGSRRIVVQVMNTGLHYSATLEADLQEVADWYLRGSATLPFLVWRDTPPQHFDNQSGEYPGGQPPFTCTPLLPAVCARRHLLESLPADVQCRQVSLLADAWSCHVLHLT